MIEAAADQKRKELGALLRRKREERELTQAALADAIGVDQASISRVESGTGGLELMLRCAHELGAALEVTT